MCGVCGCSETIKTSKLNDALAGQGDANTPASIEHHDHQEQLISIEQDLMAKNQGYAQQNREFLAAREVLAFNVMSSPGSGKTTLLARTMADLRDKHACAVIVGDQQTDADATMIKASGGNALQINTGKVCHLDAHMLGHAMETLNPLHNSLLFIENIGNLVCPALFDLGAHRRVVILSVTEGENKPLKYPDMFRIADLVLITKTDLLPYLDFDMAQCRDYIHRIQPKAGILEVSTKSGEGLEAWYQWLEAARCQHSLA